MIYRYIIFTSLIFIGSLLKSQAQWLGNSSQQYFLGNVGIGTDTPNSKLDIKLATDSDFLRIRRSSSTGRSQLVLSNESNSTIWRMGMTGAGSNSFSFYDGTNNTLQLEQAGNIYFNPQGNIGIGLSTNPEGLLTIKSIETIGGKWDPISSHLKLEDATNALILDPNEIYSSNSLAIGSKSGNIVTFRSISDSGSEDKMIIRNDGKVGIGTDLTGGSGVSEAYNLYVTKGIRTEKVKVDVADGSWADYVFEEDYKLTSLQEVENYIKENKHLPNIPTAEEVEKEGLNLGEMDAKLLQKVEELTLYLIEQNKIIKNQNRRILELETKLKDK